MFLNLVLLDAYGKNSLVVSSLLHQGSVLIRSQRFLYVCNHLLCYSHCRCDAIGYQVPSLPCMAMPTPSSNGQPRLIEEEVHVSCGKVHVVRTSLTSGQQPVFVLPGFLRGHGNMRALQNLLAEHGLNEMILFDKSAAARSRLVQVPRNLHGQQSHIERGGTIVELCDALRVERADALTHSEGGLLALWAGLQRPGLFDTIVMANPPGLMKHENGFRVTFKYLLLSIKYGLHELLSPQTPLGKEMKLAGYGEKAWHLRQGVRNILAQVLSLSQAKIDSHLARLTAHTNVGVLLTTGDLLYPPPQPAKAAKRAGVSVKIVPGQHDEITFSPERIVGEMLTMLKELRSS